jgi:ParB-like chromosome segregation protein Spo0J
MHEKMHPLDSIRSSENNLRINETAVEVLAASIRAYGLGQLIVVDEAGVIIVGHTRCKAARRLGLTEVPVHVAVGPFPPQSLNVRARG